MTTEIKPIETEYDGYLFRSRLEARWAVFFNECGWKWEYETEGYDLDGTHYLPDFILHDVWVDEPRYERGDQPYVGNLTVEIKGLMSEEDYKKVCLYRRFIGPILVLGNIPRGETEDEICSDIRSFNKNDYYGSIYGFYNKAHICTRCDVRCIYGWKDCFAFRLKKELGEEFLEDACPMVYNNSCRFLIQSDFGNIPILHNAYRPIEIQGEESVGNVDATIKAYKAARQARFEWGETPQ